MWKENRGFWEYSFVLSILFYTVQEIHKTKVKTALDYQVSILVHFSSIIPKYWRQAEYEEGGGGISLIDLKADGANSIEPTLSRVSVWMVTIHDMVKQETGRAPTAPSCGMLLINLRISHLGPIP